MTRENTTGSQNGVTKEELVERITHAVKEYVNAPEYFDANPQLRINAATFDVVAENGKDAYQDMADNVEATEDEAAAQGDETEDATDWQAAQNPDFYAIKDYVKVAPDGKMTIDLKAVDKLADSYFE